MYLDYSKLKSGEIRQPVLRLKTMAGKTLGAIPYVHNLKFDIRYADISEMEFEVPYLQNGTINPLYQAITGYKVVYTDDLGIYILATPKKSGNGLMETKTVHGYSLEKLFEKKRLFLEEGTYNFWNPDDPDDTVLGRILETDRTWHPGYVDPRLIGCYRTFDQYDSDPLTFCYSNAAEKYQCVVVFDVYDKMINVYDASKSGGTLPIYLSHQNLVDTVDVEEQTDELATKLRVYGADDLSIWDVNPTGADYLINLDYFISNGELDVRLDGAEKTLADRVKEWEAGILLKQTYYTRLVAARASKIAQKLSAEAELTELNGDMDALLAAQSAIIQAYSLEDTKAGRDDQQEVLDAKNDEITEKKKDIRDKEAEIKTLQDEIDEDTTDIQSVHDELGFTTFFSENEQTVLNHYLIESEVSEETFVASDVEASASGELSTISGVVQIEQSKIERIDEAETGIYVFSGGRLRVVEAGITADIVRGTMEEDADAHTYVLTLYLGATTHGENDYQSGTLTVSGRYTQISSDISAVTVDGVTTYQGECIELSVEESKAFFTVNVNDYQKYSVARELYDFGAGVLEEKAWPVYEFSISSANFLFQKEFEPFKDELRLGRGVHLNLGSDGVVTANIIGISLDFEHPEEFALIFSNRFQSIDQVRRPMSELKQYGASSRSFDANKYIYNRAASKSTQVSRFMESQINAAVNSIRAANNQSVLIDGAGIHIGGESDVQVRMINDMIAMSDDNFQTAKVAIGRFASPETGVQFGVNAEVIAGKLYVGHNLILENTKDDGTMMFKVDATGAWLYNAPYVMQSDHGGELVIHPDYGLAAGTGNLFTTSGTTVIPAFIDSNGDVELDSDGMPKNANFYLDARDGSAYFRGKVIATSGVFNGVVKASDFQLKSGETFTSILNAAKNAITGDYIESLTADKITAGTIDANVVTISNLVVGSNVAMGENATISWSNVTGKSAVTNAIASAQDAANSAASDAAYAEQLAKKIANGTYSGGTFISGKTIYSPEIVGDEISVKGGKFHVYDSNGTEFGYIGRAHGAISSTEKTNGIAMSTVNIAEIEHDTVGNYVIVTTAGVRMHSGSNIDLYLTPSGAYYKNSSGDTVEIGGNTATFG